MLQYRDPKSDKDVLEVIASIKSEKLMENVASSICYSIQIDGNLDRQQIDNKFVCIRYMEGDGTIQNAFLGVFAPEKNGASGFLEAMISVTDMAHLPLDNIVGISTDGESANTGSCGGLWKYCKIN